MRKLRSSRYIERKRDKMDRKNTGAKERIHDTGLTGKGISIRNVQVFIAVVTLLISALLLVATYRATAGFRMMQKETNSYIRLQKSAEELQKASDYLTEQVRCYSETGDLRYLNNYFTEAKETRRRDKALEELTNIMGDSKAVQSLSSAMDSSVGLMDREYYSMRLTSEACGYDVSELPEEIGAVKLSDKDASLDAEGKDALAMQRGRMLSRDRWSSTRSTIRKKMIYTAI